MRPVVFAIPGDIDTQTGGYIYEKEVLHGLQRMGRDVAHLRLPGSYPEPSDEDLAITSETLRAIPAQTPVLLDGFLSGASPPHILAQMQAPFVPITHHPLALENGLSKERAAVLRRTERANLARAAHVIVPSRHTADILTGQFDVAPGQITVVPPGIRPPSPRRHHPERRDGPTILSVGQLVPRKGHDVLLSALHAVRDLRWQATIVGKAADHDYACQLRDLRANLDLQDRVRLAGEVSRDALADHYARADLFALATRYEGYGMVFAEALTYGLPLVASAGGAAAETVPQDCGLLVPPDDSHAFAAALRRMIADTDARARMGANAERRGAALPRWDDTARLVSDVLEHVAR